MGRGTGAALSRLDRPRNIFVDADRTVYVSESGNDWVTKWMTDAKESFVDRIGSVCVVDGENDRLIRPLNGAKKENC